LIKDYLPFECAKEFQGRIPIVWKSRVENPNTSQHLSQRRDSEDNKMGDSSREKFRIGFLLSPNEDSTTSRNEETTPMEVSPENQEGENKTAKNKEAPQSPEQEEKEEDVEGELYHNLELQNKIEGYLQPVEQTVLKLHLQTFEGVVTNHILELRVTDQRYSKYLCPVGCGKVVKGRGNYARHLTWHVKNITNAFFKAYYEIQEKDGNPQYLAHQHNFPRGPVVMIDPKLYLEKTNKP